MPDLLLKARPTAVQLADRMRTPLPDGLELYLDSADLRDQPAMNGVLGALHAAKLPANFALLIEGPIRTLDGSFFTTTRCTEQDLLLVSRLVSLGRAIEARAINLHLIRPDQSLDAMAPDGRDRSLRGSLPFVQRFVDAVAGAGMIPTLENMPPVLRMREGGFFYSEIGMAAEDLSWMCERVPGLRVCLDLSHAQLFVNACALASRARLPRRYAELLRRLRLLPGAESIRGYARSLGEHLFSCHVSNASGMLGEGRSYGRGDLDLDTLLPTLADQVRYFVTETLERRPERATLMRSALHSMRAALRGPQG